MTSSNPRHSAPKRSAAPIDRTLAQASVDQVDTRYLESLLGYNARRAALAVIGLFLERMAVFDLRPVDFSVLSVIAHNPGVTSRQICATLGLLPPNLVGMVNRFARRSLIERREHPHDGRAWGLHLTPQGRELMANAEQTATELEQGVAAKQLSAAELQTLLSLLQRIYKA